MAAATEEKVRKQIEFYLSSSNLMKDKFLRPIVQADPKGYVDVAMFANFPRVQSITRDLELLVRALRKSSTLKVNRDGTRVKRKEPFVEYDTEANTVYAEHLPEGYDHDVVRGMFEQHGAVNYVSLPRNPDKSFKGFAFIEFAQHDGAVAAVNALNAFHPTDNPTGLRVLHKNDWLEMKRKFQQMQRGITSRPASLAKKEEEEEKDEGAEESKPDVKKKEKEKESDDETTSSKKKAKKRKRSSDGKEESKKKKKKSKKEEEENKKKKAKKQKSESDEEQKEKKRKKKEKKEKTKDEETKKKKKSKKGKGEEEDKKKKKSKKNK
ncbi:La domain containing protein [Acanthamoeba castellanii str. Neff]|uniref:La domain containing protein n=1 Tax=Acanthamoeba castellanii (strain ATCC 30010 / Neff) TaxID=1257118 RepID=L8H1E9_ACACF|nr:La domain containing protein [Acanthamoeba castellanii str. Neff]ELR18196.1 La domain containing protein [Acanthamoeba castellanii str. Neff]